MKCFIITIFVLSILLLLIVSSCLDHAEREFASTPTPIPTASPSFTPTPKLHRTPTPTFTPEPTATTTPTFFGTTFSRQYEEKGAAESIIQVDDGGYVYLANVSQYYPGEYMLLRKIDEHGTEVWSHSFEGDSLYHGQEVLQTEDGGYAISGRIIYDDYGQSELFLIKTNAQGVVDWEKRYTFTEYDQRPVSLKLTQDDGFIIAGNCQTEGSNFALLIKTDQSGQIEWTRNLGTWWATSVETTLDGGYIVAALHAMAVRLDSQGNILWTKTFEWNYSSFSNIQVTTIKRTMENNYILTGLIEHNDDISFSLYIYLVLINDQADTIWKRYFRESWSGVDVNQTDDGGYIITGAYTSEFYLLKTDKLGKFSWFRDFTRGSSQGNCVIQTQDRGFIAAGSRAEPIYAPRITIIKTDVLGNVNYSLP